MYLKTAPGLNEKCDSVCIRPLKCTQRTGAAQGHHEKVCLCQEPYKMIDGSCQLGKLLEIRAIFSPQIYRKSS